MITEAGRVASSRVDETKRVVSAVPSAIPWRRFSKLRTGEDEQAAAAFADRAESGNRRSGVGDGGRQHEGVVCLDHVVAVRGDRRRGGQGAVRVGGADLDDERERGRLVRCQARGREGHRATRAHGGGRRGPAGHRVDGLEGGVGRQRDRQSGGSGIGAGGAGVDDGEGVGQGAIHGGGGAPGSRCR